MKSPLCIDLFAGTLSWSAGWLALGGRVIGYDLEHEPHHGPVPPGADLVLQDVRTIDGARLKDASLILASPPCQRFSYMAMPWSRSKAMIAEYEASAAKRAELTELFDACFRIQREASTAAGRHIPMVVENVRGAQRWVGRSRWHFGSFHLFGDVPALMPITPRRSIMKRGIAHRGDNVTNFHGVKVDRQLREEGIKVGDVGWRRDNAIPSQTFIDAAVEGVKCGGSAGDDWFAHHNRPEFEKRAGLIVPIECRSCGLSATVSSGAIEADLEDFRRTHAQCTQVVVGKAEPDRATKNSGGSWFNIAHNTNSGTGQNPDGRKTSGHVNQGDGYGHTRHLTNQAESDAVKSPGDWFDYANGPSPMRRVGSKSSARKAASALIARIPYPLSLWIASTYFPH